MSEAAGSSGNFCYRHPDRQSYVLCQRCGRTICPDCQTQAAVGVHCPECVKEARGSAPRTKPRFVTAFSRSSDRPVVTYSIIVICAVIYVLQLVSGGLVTSLLLYVPQLTYVEPWRMITALFVHSQNSFLHILFNMYALYIFGPTLEHMLGRGRFLALYLLCGFGGSVAVLDLGAGPVVGASGAIFGLMGAYFMIQRRLGGNSTQLVIVIGLNLAIGFFLPGIAWQAHLGGLIVGGLVALIFLRTRRLDQQRTQVLLMAAVGLGLVLLTLLPIALPSVFPLRV